MTDGVWGDAAGPPPVSTREELRVRLRALTRARTEALLAGDGDEHRRLTRRIGDVLEQRAALKERLRRVLATATAQPAAGASS